jgi:uncharacterized membrane protein YccC
MDREHRETLELMKELMECLFYSEDGTGKYEFYLPQDERMNKAFTACQERIELLEPKETHVDYSDLETMVESILSSLYDIKNNKASEYNYDQCADWLEENKYLMFPERQEIEGLLDYIGRR